ncbi:MAG: hypothetical protein ACI4VE_03215 [Clostridia bacterium]
MENRVEKYFVIFYYPDPCGFELQSVYELEEGKKFPKALLDEISSMKAYAFQFFKGFRDEQNVVNFIPSSAEGKTYVGTFYSVEQIKSNPNYFKVSMRFKKHIKEAIKNGAIGFVLTKEHVLIPIVSGEEVIDELPS